MLSNPYLCFTLWRPPPMSRIHNLINFGPSARRKAHSDRHHLSVRHYTHIIVLSLGNDVPKVAVANNNIYMCGPSTLMRHTHTHPPTNAYDLQRKYTNLDACIKEEWWKPNTSSDNNGRQAAMRREKRAEKECCASEEKRWNGREQKENIRVIFDSYEMYPGK